MNGKAYYVGMTGLFSDTNHVSAIAAVMYCEVPATMDTIVASAVSVNSVPLTFPCIMVEGCGFTVKQTKREGYAEMTMEEIEAKLGYRVKLVDENS